MNIDHIQQNRMITDEIIVDCFSFVDIFLFFCSYIENIDSIGKDRQMS
jgi:hypothetical protein